MTHRDETPVIGLPIFDDNDKPTWRGDVNESNRKIDRAVLQLKNAITQLELNNPGGGVAAIRFTAGESVEFGTHPIVTQRGTPEDGYVVSLRPERGPQGLQGIQGKEGREGPGGARGPAPRMYAGTATTLPPESDVTVALVETAAGEYRVDVGVPQGIQGEQGVQGVKGEPGNATGVDNGDGTITLTF